MANSKVGQYRMEFTLTGFTNPVRTHVCGLWVAPTTTPGAGSLPEDIDIQLLGGGTDSLDNVALAYAERIRVFYDAAVVISQYTLWRFVTENQRVYVTSGSVTTTATAGSGITPAWQITMTFRHANGGTSTHVLLESSFNGNQYNQLIANPSGNQQQQYAAYIMSNISPCIALDNSFPVQPLRFAEEENEYWQGKLYRP